MKSTHRQQQNETVGKYTITPLIIDEKERSAMFKMLVEETQDEITKLIFNSKSEDNAPGSPTSDVSEEKWIRITN